MTANNTNKRLIKNSTLLFLRMFFTMSIGFYTTRIVLKYLGDVDFGLYNVVGGVIYMLAFIQSALANSTSKYITCALALNDTQKLNRTFHSTLSIHLIIGLLLLLVFETIGLSFFYALNIPDNRINQCMYIYQLSAITVFLNIITNPYRATIIAYERFTAYAYTSIIDVVFKLIIVYLLIVFDYDKLLTYGTLIFATNIINILIIIFYVKINFKELKYGLYLNILKLKEMLSFTSWSILGTLSNIIRFQGLNYILNIFCGPVANAARGLSFQIQSIIMRFVQNIQVSINPQIYKSYTCDDFNYLKKLIYISSKYSFLVIIIISFPLYIEIDFFLKLWLSNYPELTSKFVKVLLLGVTTEALSNPLEIAVNATGKIKSVQIQTVFIYTLFFIISYFVLKFGYSPVVTFLLMIPFNILVIIIRIRLLNKFVKITLKEYFSNIVYSILKVCFSLIVLYCIYVNVTSFSPIINIIVAFLLTISLIFIIGLEKNEREKVYNLIVIILKKYTR